MMVMMVVLVFMMMVMMKVFMMMGMMIVVRGHQVAVYHNTFNNTVKGRIMSIHGRIFL